MGARKLKHSNYYTKKKRSHLRLVTDKDSAKWPATVKDQHHKKEIRFYQDLIHKQLEDPKMVKKAAQILLDLFDQDKK